MAANVASELVPFRWPAEWTDPGLLSLFENGPVNCLVFDSPAGAITEAARKAGMSSVVWKSLNPAPVAEAKWDGSAPIVALTNLVWPRIKLSQGGPDQVASGPTGAPWIDSNCWVARLAAARAPSKQIWLGFEPPKDEAPPSENAYRVAVADAYASGARWVVSLDAKLSASVARGASAALRTWKGIQSTLDFFEKRKAWRGFRHDGPLGAVSSFAGADEFMSVEFLNLAARRNLLYRVIDRSRLLEADLEGLRAVIWLDQQTPPPEAVAKLTAFAQNGGMVILSRPAAGAIKGERELDCAVAGYRMLSLGRGSVVQALREWDDPYFLAADAHNLVSRRYDPVRLFNGSSYWLHYSVSPDKRTQLIQMVSFGGGPRAGGTGTSDVSLRIRDPHSSVLFHALGAEPAPLQPVGEGRNLEYRLPPFEIYGALEVSA